VNEEFLDALHQLEKEKEIPTELLMETIEQALVHAYKKHYATADEVRVRVDVSRSGFKVFCQKTVVEEEEVENPHEQIVLAEARAHKPDAVVGDIIEFEVTPRELRPHRRADRQAGCGAAAARCRTGSGLR